MWTSALFAYFFILFVESSTTFIKCCPNGYAFGNDMRCIMSIPGDNETAFKQLIVGNETEFTHTCYRSGEGVDDLHPVDENVTTIEKCVDFNHRNGTVYVKRCPLDWRDKLGRCDSLMKPLFFWGASIVVFANAIYIFPYIVVIVFFFAVADLRKRAYDKAVLGYNASQLVTALVLLVIGCFVLCHRPIKPAWIYIVLGLTLQFLTIASVFWLNVICFDMTLVITRFRWTPGSDITGSEEARKFRMYGAYAWGVAAIVTAITCFVELCPLIPTSSPLKPNFERFDDGANYAVILYVSTLPVIALVLNNVLFSYTTYKVIKIRKSTAVANENNRNLRKKYFIFLRLYLLMDAPWIVGVMAAVYSDLWILKFCRMVQPILMLMAILPNRMYKAVKCSKTPVTNASAKIKTNNKTVETRC